MKQCCVCRADGCRWDELRRKPHWEKWVLLWSLGLSPTPFILVTIMPLTNTLFIHSNPSCETNENKLREFTLQLEKHVDNHRNSLKSHQQFFFPPSSYHFWWPGMWTLSWGVQKCHWSQGWMGLVDCDTRRSLEPFGMAGSWLAGNSSENSPMKVVTTLQNRLSKTQRGYLFYWSKMNCWFFFTHRER